jgi:hypothetical protein
MNSFTNGTLFGLGSATIILALFLAASCEDRGTSGDAQYAEMRTTEHNQQRLLKAVPPPRMETSLERKQLVRRLTRFNVADKISYIYLLSDYGTVITFFPIKGKVSSVNSLLTTPHQVLTPGGQGRGSAVVSSPDLDGSYGSNGDAIFFFTTEDVYVEWNGKYVLVDQPLQLTTKPLLVRDVVPKK